MDTDEHRWAFVVTVTVGALRGNASGEDRFNEEPRINTNKHEFGLGQI
jgi:hypothetical protein